MVEIELLCFVREKRRCVGARMGTLGIIVIELLCFRRLYPFFKHTQKAFPGFA
jgi:hypothetical protein